LKGIKGGLWEMKIELKPYAKSIKKIPYRLNPRVRQKFKEEIDIILAFGLIFPLKKFNWISPIIIWDKKIRTSETRILW
jgi:hypothetical protein